METGADSEADGMGIGTPELWQPESARTNPIENGTTAIFLAADLLPRLGRS